MNEHPRTEELDDKSVPAPQPEVVEEQQERTRIKIQSDVHAGIVDGNGTLYP